MEQNHSKLRELFIAACDLPQHEQVALVDERCADDPEMRKELLSLLRSDGQESGIFCEDKTTNGIQFELDTVVDSELPDRIGQYEVKNVLGKGGMGIVYLAQQKNPRRDVAVKVIRSGMIGPELLKRFEFEAAVLGRLTHPGIANIYEAGVFVESTSGLERPFLAMEYVEGRSLRNYIDRSNPTQSERLRLLVQMCEAVHHAHQRGVIHRDLKPGNVVVKDNGQPSVLDFGVARATESDPDMPTLQTRAGQLVGTLRYMSPEQVRGNGLDVDTRSDVYSLGVIAYELLTGKLPYTVHAKDYLESAKVIAQENPRPMQLLDRKFRGDVNTIVLKALEKEPDRRYQSAKALGDDIQRYLDDQPIVARKSSWLEHRWRWCRRNQAIASLAALMGLMTVFGISGWIYLEKQRANVVAAAVTSISDSMNNARVHQRLANAAGSEVNPNRVLQVREIEQALASALDAAKQAESTGINEALRKSTRQLRDDLIAEASIARKLADQASFDQALQEDFELTRLANSSLTAYPANETDAQATETSNTSRFAVTTYEQLFRKAGLDPIGDDILQTSAKIKEFYDPSEFDWRTG